MFPAYRHIKHKHRSIHTTISCFFSSKIYYECFKVSKKQTENNTASSTFIYQIKHLYFYLNYEVTFFISNKVVDIHLNIIIGQINLTFPTMLPTVMMEPLDAPQATRAWATACVTKNEPWWRVVSSAVFIYEMIYQGFMKLFSVMRQYQNCSNAAVLLWLCTNL